MMAADDPDEIVLDSEEAGCVVALVPCDPPAAVEGLPRADGFGDDEWAARLSDGRIVAFLREPVGRCHLDRVLVIDGERRFERPLPAWIYYGFPTFFAAGPRLLIGGPRGAWIVAGDGAVTTVLEEDDGGGVHVAWVDEDTAVAAGWRQVVFDRWGVRTTLSCNRAVGICVVRPVYDRAPGGHGGGGGDDGAIIVVSDEDGSAWIRDGRVVARDWRPYASAQGDVIVSGAGDAYRVRVSAG